MTATPAAELAAAKNRLRDVWGLGDYSIIGTTLQLSGELLCETVDFSAGDRVLDVAAGNGNAALAAARRGGQVVAADYVDRLLEQASARAAAEGLQLDCRQADAEALPFNDGEFDVVLSTFGVMFTTDHRRAADELVRVCRPGGRVGLTAWTPDSFIGRVLQTVRSYVAQPPELPSPLMWGDHTGIEELLGERTVITSQMREHIFRYHSARAWLDTFRTYYGPLHSAFGRIGSEAGRQLETELLVLAESSSTDAAGRMRVPSAYLEVVAVPTA
jgi:SAM-dependent methyltransferase